MDAVSLMNRHDSKFVFHRNLLLSVLEELQSDYRILEVKGNRLSRYETIYFDTEDFLFYHLHHNGKRNRLKVRIRQYVDIGLTFMEIKKKNNKSRTVKKRIKVGKLSQQFDQQGLALLKAYTDLDPKSIRPTLHVNFKRITLVCRDMSERLTIDIDLVTSNSTRQKDFRNIVIAEVKQDGKNLHSPFFKVMRKYRIHENRFSKYCMGIIYTHPGIKINRFKPRILKLNKITNGTFGLRSA